MISETNCLVSSGLPNTAVDVIGYHGPHILLIMTVSQIWKQTPYLWAFLGGFFVNKNANEWLKYRIKQPRPHTISLPEAQNRDLVFRLRCYLGLADPDKNYVSPAHVYGMPSGHAQAAGYATGFLYLTKSKLLSTLPATSPLVAVFFAELFVCAVTMYQRWESRAHTVAQITIGLALGGGIAWIVHTVTHRWLEVLPGKNIA
jgi:hypothetical protein